MMAHIPDEALSETEDLRDAGAHENRIGPTSSSHCVVP